MGGASSTIYEASSSTKAWLPTTLSVTHMPLAFFVPNHTYP